MVLPARISTVETFTVTFDVSLLVRATNTPPAGAGAASMTGSEADCPGATVTPVANVISAASRHEELEAISAKTAVTKNFRIGFLLFDPGWVTQISRGDSIPMIVNLLPLPPKRRDFISLPIIIERCEYSYFYYGILIHIAGIYC